MNRKELKATNRIEWIDIAKGIGILLVIIGHTIGFSNDVEKALRGIIYSFHMPLFFILNGITFQLSISGNDFISKIERSFKHLVIPTFVLYIFIVIIEIINKYDDIKLMGWTKYIAEKINSYIYASGVDVNVAGGAIPALGILWFLIVLFSGRIIFDYFHLRLKGRSFFIINVVCTIIGIIIGSIQWLPFSFDISLSIMPFFQVGLYLKKLFKNSHYKYSFINLGIWVISLAICYILTHSYLELSCRIYPAFPLCYLSSISATLFVAHISCLISEHIITRPLAYLGKNSMYMLWVHVMDYIFYHVWHRFDNNFLNSAIRLFIDLVLFSILMIVIKFIKECRFWRT